MRIHSQDFKNAVSAYGREIKHKITYWENGEQKEVEDIISANSITNTDLLKTVMKEFYFNSKKQIDKGTIVKYQFGVKVNNTYEYLNFGEYIIKENDWNADTNSFVHTCYDAMLNTMVSYYTPIDAEYPITVNNYIKLIANECGLEFANYNIPFCNYDVLINEDHFNNGNYTFRNVLDYLAEIVAGWIIINRNGRLEIKYPTNTNEIFDKDFLSDVNITFKNKYGAVNSVAFARGGGSDIIYKKDDNDIATNGLHELRFDDNPFLEGTDRENFIDGVYEELHGLNFYVMDINSPGICYLEIGDYFTFELNQNSAMKSGLTKSGLYKAQNQNGGKIKCLMLNDEIDFSQGINEHIYSDEPSSSVTNYKTSNITDNSIKNAVILTNKNAGQIVLKANSDGKLVQVALNGNANNGSEFNVKADNINLEGYTTINGGFSVDTSGNATMNNATVNGGSIELSGTESSPKFKIKNPTYNDRYTEYLPNTIRMWRDGKTTVQINSLMNAAGFTAWDYSDEDKQVIVNAWLMSIKDNTNRTLIEPSGITTPTVTQTSKEEYKKNFEKLINAKEILKNTDIYKYNLIDDKDTDKKHIGFVIGDKFNYSKEITSKNNDGVDIYSMVSVLWQVVKEQEEEIELLKERIDKYAKNNF